MQFQDELMQVLALTSPLTWSPAAMYQAGVPLCYIVPIVTKPEVCKCGRATLITPQPDLAYLHR